MPSPSDFIKYKTITLNRRDFHSRHLIDPVLARATIDREDTQDFQTLKDHIAYRMSTYIMGREITGITITQPATWLDALKLEHFPAWALRRWPARYESTVLTAWQAFPEFECPQFGPSLLLRSFEAC